MTRQLLDVNVLIALLDPDHVHHGRAHAWFESSRAPSWLSCPTTQNGVLRIVSNPKYPNSQPPGLVAASLESLLETDGHEFVPDSLSLLAPEVDRARLLSSKQITDTYLLAIAAANRATLATLDMKIVTSAIASGGSAVTQVP